MTYTLRKMHKEILSKEQLEILPFLSGFNSKFYLVGGTAIALQIGHRTSIDFDLFSAKSFSTKFVYHKLNTQTKYNFSVIWSDKEQFHCNLNSVKVTFYPYPYVIPLDGKFEKYFKMPSLLTLAAMKALALGGLAKWKDYVDLYYLLKSHFSLEEITLQAKSIFGDGAFNAKLLKEQLSYFKDIDYSEEVFYTKGFETSEEEIKSFLTDISVKPF